MNRKKKLHRELQRIKRILVKDYKAEKLILFGSLAQGTVHPWSDIDLVIVKRTKKKFLRRLKEVALLTRPRVGVDFFVYTPAEFQEMALDPNSFHHAEIENKGIVVYDRG